MPLKLNFVIDEVKLYKCFALIMMN